MHSKTKDGEEYVVDNIPNLTLEEFNSMLIEMAKPVAHVRKEGIFIGLIALKATYDNPDMGLKFLKNICTTKDVYTSQEGYDFLKELGLT